MNFEPFLTLEELKKSQIKSRSFKMVDFFYSLVLKFAGMKKMVVLMKNDSFKFSERHAAAWHWEQVHDIKIGFFLLP